MRSAKGRKEVIKRIFVSDVDGRQPQAHLVFITFKYVVVTDGHIEKLRDAIRGGFLSSFSVFAVTDRVADFDFGSRDDCSSLVEHGAVKGPRVANRLRARKAGCKNCDRSPSNSRPYDIGTTIRNENNEK